jgi:6-phosphogluconolactonase/glucosamine-6-phosphate isomerase/deaminase
MLGSFSRLFTRPRPIVPDITRHTDIARLVELAQHHLQTLLESTESTLILLSGGSARVLAEVLIEQVVSGRGDHFMVGMIDDRYGPVGHAQSNAVALEEEYQLWSVLKYHGVPHREILTGRSLEDEAEAYASWLDKAVALCPRRVGILGIGSDGHTAGILPIPRERYDQIYATERLVVGYDSHDQFHQRVTLSPYGLTKLTDVVVLACGQDKGIALAEALQMEPEPPLWKVPAVALRHLARASVFTDRLF